MIAGILICIFLFALAIWVFQIRASIEVRERMAEQMEDGLDGENEGVEMVEGDNIREGFSFGGLFNKVRQRIQDEINRRRREMEELFNRRRREMEEIVNRRRREEEERRLNALTSQWRDILARNFYYISMVPNEIRARLNAEILAAEKRKREYEAKVELERKQNARKVIDHILKLTERLPDITVVLSLVSILEGKDRSNDIYLLKNHSQKPNHFVEDMLQELKKQPIDTERVKQMASLLREYNCDNDEFCFARSEQWNYASVDDKR
jgi:hypothetical protein